MTPLPFTWRGQTLHLLLNGAALFDIFDRFGANAEIPELIAGSSRKSLENTCWILAKLAEQGELARRFLGFERETPPMEQELLTLMTPMEIPLARLAITRAVRLGFDMRHQDPEEYVDLGLRELQKKTASKQTGFNIFNWLRSFFTSLCGRRKC